MKFYQLSPQTAGCFGDDTLIQDINARPPEFSNFHFELNDWPEDDLIEASIGGYAGTLRLAEAIGKEGLTGVDFDRVVMIEGDQFYKCRNEHPQEKLPEFLWLKFNSGIAGEHDFGLIRQPVEFDLVVSQRAFDLLRTFKLERCRYKEFDRSIIQIATEE